MSTRNLMESLRGSAGDEELRRVVADALLEANDPRGELMIAQLDRRMIDDELLERCVSTVRDGVPGLQRVRIEAGLVTELELELIDVPRIDLEWLASEPLACITAGLPTEDDDVGPALVAATVALGACRGFQLASRLLEKARSRVLQLITDACPAVLGLDLGPELPLGADDPVWPSVEIAALSGPGSDAARRFLSRSLPSLRRLALRGPDGIRCLQPALELRSLDHLDLRGQALSDEDLERLAVWRDALPGRSVRHERFDLGPADLDDVFGARGVVWEPDPPLKARVAAVPGDDLTFACSRGVAVQLHLRDAPEWQREADAPVTAITARDRALIVGRDDGVVEAWPLDSSRVERITKLPGAIRSLSTTSEDVAATFDGGWWVSRGEQGEDGMTALALTSAGMARADGTRVRITGVTDRVVELGDPVLALAATDDVVVAVAGRHVWRLAGSAPPELLGTRRSGRPAVAVRDDCVAWITSRHAAELLRGEERCSVTYPGTYSGGCDEELVVADLAAAASGTIVAALEHGGMNLLNPEGAMKADEFPGEPHRRWILIYGGDILIAE